MDFLNDWLSWSNMFYLIGLIVAGYATTVTAANRQIVKEIGDLVKALESGYKDNRITKSEKDLIMKEALDIGKAVIQSRWKFWGK